MRYIDYIRNMSDDQLAYFLNDPEVGVAMCIAKKYFGSRNQLLKAAGNASGEHLKRLVKEQKGK